MSLPNQFIHVTRSAALKGDKALIQIYTWTNEKEDERQIWVRTGMDGWMDCEGILFVARHCLMERCRFGAEPGVEAFRDPSGGGREQEDVHSDELLSIVDVIFQSILLQNVMSRRNGIVGFAADQELLQLQRTFLSCLLAVSDRPCYINNQPNHSIALVVVWDSSWEARNDVVIRRTTKSIKIFQLFAANWIQFNTSFSMYRAHPHLPSLMQLDSMGTNNQCQTR